MEMLMRTSGKERFGTSTYACCQYDARHLLTWRFSIVCYQE